MYFRIFRAGLVIPAALFLTAQFLASPAQATEGYFQHGYGIVSKALAGAGVAASHDAMTQALNPAGLVGVRNQVNVGVSFFSPIRSYEANGAAAAFPGGFVGDGSVDSGREIFVIPNIGVSYQIDEASAAGIAIYGNGGMNTRWKGSDSTCTAGAAGTFCDGTSGVDLTQVFIQSTYAREIVEGVRIGAGPIFAIQSFEAKGLSFFGGFSSDAANLSDNGHDISVGFGGRAGIQADVLPTVSVGAAYQMRTYMDEFDKYAGLFAEQGDFDIPAAAQAGVAWQATPELLLLFDFKYIWYSSVDAIANDFASAGDLGDDNGPGFGWEDTSIVKIGVQWDVDDQWTVRGGYSYTDQPIPDSQVLFNILAPGVMEHHFTAGVSYVLNDSISLNFGGFYAPKSSVTGTNALDPQQTITIEMSQVEVQAGIAWRF